MKENPLFFNLLGKIFFKNNQQNISSKVEAALFTYIFYFLCLFGNARLSK